MTRPVPLLCGSRMLHCRARALLGWVAGVAGLLATSPLDAQESASADGAQQLPPEQAPIDDPRKGPRLEYKRGPNQCLDETRFRQRVSYWLDGVDHLAADSPDVVRVAFERAPGGGYRATVAYTDAAGKSAPPETVVQEGEHCGALAWWVALVVSERVPPKPPRPCPKPPPCPECPPPTCSPCPPCVRVCPACPAPKPKSSPWYEGSMIDLYTFVLLTGGLFADPGAAFSLGVALRGKAPEDPWIPTYSFGLEGRFAVPGRVVASEPFRAGPTYPRSFEIGQATGLFAGCARWKYAFGCGVVQGGMYFGTDGDYVPASSGVFALGPRIGGRLPLGEHIALFAFGEMLFPPARIGFKPVVAPGAEPEPNVIWLPSVVQGYGAAGVEFTFE
jgi:hypothetical protein